MSRDVLVSLMIYRSGVHYGFDISENMFHPRDCMRVSIRFFSFRWSIRPLVATTRWTTLPFTLRFSTINTIENREIKGKIAYYWHYLVGVFLTNIQYLSGFLAPHPTTSVKESLTHPAWAGSILQIEPHGLIELCVLNQHKPWTIPNISVQSWTIEPAEDRYKKYRYHPKGEYVFLFKSLKYLCKSVSNCIFWVHIKTFPLLFYGRGIK